MAGFVAALMAVIAIFAGGRAALAGELEAGRASLAAGDYAEAERVLLPLAQQGDAEARAQLLNVARKYFAGTDIPRQCAQAFAIMKTLADLDYLPAIASLGIAHLRGCGEIAADVPEGIRLVRSAAERGDPRGQGTLGWAYATGTGVTRDYGEAIRWSRMSADQGEAQAQGMVGALYAAGNGVPKDLLEAERWLRKSVAQGDASARMNLLSVAVAYYSGADVPRQCRHAVELMKDLVDKAFLPAFGQLGFVYLNGCSDVAANPTEAVRLWRYAAERGDARAQGFLGSAYANGTGVARDYAEAMRWYRKAAEQKLPAAQADIGVMYLKGEGVPADRAEATRWLELAAAQGNARAIELLDQLQATATPERFAVTIGDRARKADAAALAKSYLFSVATLQMMKLVDAGATIQTREGVITNANVAEAAENFRVREAVYGTVIRERGFVTVGGRYRAAATAACERAQSSWAASVGVAALRDIELRQDGFRVTVEHHGETGHAPGLAATGVIVESSLVIADPMNSDYILVGVVEDGAITLRPDAEGILAAWPPSIPRPTRQDLVDCVVTLTRSDGGAQTSAGVPAPPASAADPGAVPSAEATRPTAADLARHYRMLLRMEAQLKSVDAGGTVATPAGPITKDNVAAARERVQAGKAAYGNDIRARGFKDVGGRYRTTAPAACIRVHSTWATAVRSGTSRELEIRQDGFVATARLPMQTGPGAPAVVVESTLAFSDPMNASYSFIGVIEGDVIALHPDAEVLLKSWPFWIATPPTAKELADCTITLTRIR